MKQVTKLHRIMQETRQQIKLLGRQNQQSILHTREKTYEYDAWGKLLRVSGKKKQSDNAGNKTTNKTSGKTAGNTAAKTGDGANAAGPVQNS